MKLSRWALALGSFVLVALLGVIGWEWRHPTAFSTYEGGTTIELKRPQPDGSLYFGMTWSGGAGGAVQVKAAEPAVTENSSEAAIEVLICRVRPGTDGSLIGSASESEIDATCDLQPLTALELNLPGTPPPTQLILKVTPRQAGRVLVQGIDLTYEQGWRSGTHRVGEGVDVRVGRRS